MEQVLDDPKINEALELLNKSAREKKDQIQKLINERYSDIKTVVKSKEGESGNVVTNNPWAFLGGAAAAFLVFGYFLGSLRD